MKPGDLVKNVYDGPPLGDKNRVGVVVRVFPWKMWKTDEMGKQIDWDKVKAQPFAEVLWNDMDSVRKVPQSDLEVVREGRSLDKR